MTLFTTLTSECFCQLIRAANHHVILVVAGISIYIVQALLNTRGHLGENDVQIVSDISGELLA